MGFTDLGSQFTMHFLYFALVIKYYPKGNEHPIQTVLPIPNLNIPSEVLLSMLPDIDKRGVIS